MTIVKHINPAYFYASLITLSVLLDLIFERNTDTLLICVGLGFMSVIYILDKILKKL